ncbi:hypothetical protein GE09DRAFT_515266 [Coniochaeta sp. 2T2.1]|nr:hypothetical protein GE09DRAFT_515266 [Coniochaeta sp. 2T2.1]
MDLLTLRDDDQSGPGSGALISWTGHRKATRFCRCATDPSTKAKIAKTDPLIAAGFHNHTCSRLSSLPEEMLLEIMAHLDPADMQCWIRTCRRFTRLSGTAPFPCDFKHRWKHSPIPLCRMGLVAFRHLPKVGSLLRRDNEGYCARCREARLSPSWKAETAKLSADLMYCTGCDADHPVALFSKAQREKSSRLLVPARACIALEGDVRICDHKTITWREISSAANKAVGNVPDMVEETVLVYRCEDEVHLPWHGTRVVNRTDSQPSVSLVGIPPSNVDSATGSTVAVIGWTAHLPLPTPSEECTRLTPAVMDQLLRDMRKGTAAEHIAPELAPGRLLEMNCFDPNLCSCLDYPGMKHLPHTWKIFSPDEPEGDDFCRKNRAYFASRRGPDGLDQAATDTPLPAFTGSHKTEISVPGAESHNSAHSPNRIKIALHRCPEENDRCLQVHYSRSIHILPTRGPGCPSESWYQCLDPESHNLTADTDRGHLTWCRERGCKNHFRYLRDVLPKRSTVAPTISKFCRPKSLGGKISSILRSVLMGAAGLGVYARYRWDGNCLFPRFTLALGLAVLVVQQYVRLDPFRRNMRSTVETGGFLSKMFRMGFRRALQCMYGEEFEGCLEGQLIDALGILNGLI